MNATMEAKPALQKGVHDRLLQDIDHIASMSNVPVSMIKMSCSDYLGKGVKSWLISYRKLKAIDMASAYMLGPLKASPEKLMMAMAAVLIRNFIDARVYSLQGFLDLEGSAARQATAVFIPNFQNSYHGKPLASHQVQTLYSILLDRMTEDKVTVLYLDSIDQMRDQYGTSISEFITKNYTQLKE